MDLVMALRRKRNCLTSLLMSMLITLPSRMTLNFDRSCLVRADS